MVVSVLLNLNKHASVIGIVPHDKGVLGVTK